MKAKRIIKLFILLLCLCLAAGTGLFLYSAHHGYKINSGFTAVPLNYSPDDSSSSHSWNGADITVYGGFVKGIQKSSNGDSLVIRALSPLPSVEIRNSGPSAQSFLIHIENISPEFYASSIDPAFNPSRITVNTLEFSLNVKSGLLPLSRMTQTLITMLSWETAATDMRPLIKLSRRLTR